MTENLETLCKNLDVQNFMQWLLLFVQLIWLLHGIDELFATNV